MRDLYLRFPNRETAVALAEQFGLYVVDSQGSDHLISASHQLAIDVVGMVCEPTGNTVTHNGMTSPEMAPVPGWHINIRVLDDSFPVPEIINQFLFSPGQTHRRWAA